VRAASAPSIAHDGGLYHLYWLAPNGDLRYATSRGADAWLVQESPLTSLPNTAWPAVARGGGRHVAVLVGGSGGVTAIDLDRPLAPHSISNTSGGAPTVTYGAGRFVAAVIGGDRRVRTFGSVDGTSWTELAQLAPARVSWAAIHFSENGFQLAAQEGFRCRRFTSSDGSAWTEMGSLGCGNTLTAVLAGRFNGRDLFFANVDNRFLQVAGADGSFQDTHAIGIDRRPALAVGGGPPLAALHLDRLRVEGEGGQDVTLVSLGFRVRIGEPASARVSFSGQLLEFATELDRGEEVGVPAMVSPFAWTVAPDLNLNSPSGRVDLLGSIEIGIERGDCPEGPIRDKVNEARAAIESALNRHLATASVQALSDANTRDATIGRVQCEVEKSLAGEDVAPCSGAPPAPAGTLLDGLVRILTAPVRFVATLVADFLTSAVCGFNEEDQLEPVAVLMLGTFLFEEGAAPRTAYRLDPSMRERAIDAVTLRSENGALAWRLTGRMLYVGN
jgi:hypothetical protein